jgi:membrane protein
VRIIKALLSLLNETFQGWQEANGSFLAAALAYYTITSLAPLLVIMVSIAGLVYDESIVRGMVAAEMSKVVGSQGASLTLTIFESASRIRVGGLATGVSLAVMAFMASMLFVRLKQAINALWGIAPHPEKGWIVRLRTHSLSILMVLLIGLLLLVSMTVSTFLVFLNHYLANMPQLAVLLQRLPEADFGMVFLLFALLFAIAFKTLPEVQIAWRDVWLGAAVTGLAFTLGEFLIGYYLARMNPGGAFGAASSVVAILIWVYYSMQIILLGAKFTQVFSNRYGSRVLPSTRAVRIIRNLEDNSKIL